MKYLLKAPKSFARIKQIDCFCLPFRSKLSAMDTVVIDLSGVDFIKPLGVIGVLTLVESITMMEEGRSPNIKIIAPSNSGVRDYLLKIDFINALKSLCDWKIPKGMKVSQRKIKPVIPITRFYDSGDIENIANAMQIMFRTELVGLATLLQPCYVVFSELAINAVEHAKSNGGFVLAQQYDYSDGSKLEISVGDCGIGISESLRQNRNISEKFHTDREAIMLTLAGGLSCVNDPHRGYGLYHVKEELVHAPDRSLTLRSGSGYAILNTGSRPYSAGCGYFPGTLAHAVIPCGGDGLEAFYEKTI